MFIRKEKLWDIYELMEKEINELLSKIKTRESFELKADLIGNKTLLEHSIRLLKKCDEHNICAGSVFTKLPKKICDLSTELLKMVKLTLVNIGLK
ncbi:MAG: hypothetical protein OQJ89_12235 [Kangiellaceae bacterium]|nr:hypothetical protein [Kangiellaceae bacterium]MCW8998840.1 hypothetical protein [Kangiellaceae bacterium]MCW9017729.1 hypothetical protein [Kangiellaceae bacterium]